MVFMGRIVYASQTQPSVVASVTYSAVATDGTGRQVLLDKPLDRPLDDGDTFADIVPAPVGSLCTMCVVNGVTRILKALKERPATEECA